MLPCVFGLSLILILRSYCFISMLVLLNLRACSLVDGLTVTGLLFRIVLLMNLDDLVFEMFDGERPLLIVVDSAISEGKMPRFFFLASILRKFSCFS